MIVGRLLKVSKNLEDKKMIEYNMSLNNFDNMKDSELENIDGGFAIGTAIIVGTLTIFGSGVFVGYTDAKKGKKK